MDDMNDGDIYVFTMRGGSHMGMEEGFGSLPFDLEVRESDWDDIFKRAWGMEEITALENSTFPG
jgi:hypothetical protein